MPENYAVPTLVSKGAPIEHGRLNTTWTKDPNEPEINGCAHFTNSKGTLHLFRTQEGLWEIAPEIDAGKAFAVARSAAAHPNTIKPGEWSLPKGGGWAKASGFKVEMQGPNTEEYPFDVVADLGVDFFLRMRTTKVVWFVDPSSGEVMHSGAKAAGATKKPGKRYCPLCEHCFSANNFVSQHLRNLHTPPAPSKPSVTPDGEGGVTLDWKIEGWAAGAEPVSFAVQFSTDGENWTTGVEDTLSSEPRAHIASLNKENTYTFRVAAHSIAALGNYSEASMRLTPDQLGNRALPSLLAASLPPLAKIAGGSPPVDDSISMSDLLDQTPPVSPAMPFPTAAGSVGGMPPPASSSSMPPPMGKTKRSDRDESGGSDGGVGGGVPMVGSDDADPGRNRATADLVWSIEELVRTAQEAEEAGESSVHMLASLFGPSKRQKKSRSREEIFLEELLESLDGDTPMDAGDAPSMDPVPMDGPQLLASSGPAFRSADRGVPEDCLRETSNRRMATSLQRYAPSTASLAEPSFTLEELSSNSQLRIAKLRIALANAPAFAKSVLLTPELLTLMGRAERSRELNLMLTHASREAVAAAAAEDATCRKAQTAYRFALPPPAQAAAASFTLPPPKQPKRTKPRAGWSALTAKQLLTYAALAAFAYAASVTTGLADAIAPPPPPPPKARGLLAKVLLFWKKPPPPPQCHWSSFDGGCVPSNAATAACDFEWSGLPLLTCSAE